MPTGWDGEVFALDALKIHHQEDKCTNNILKTIEPDFHSVKRSTNGLGVLQQIHGYEVPFYLVTAPLTPE